MIIDDFSKTAEQIEMRINLIIQECRALIELLDVCFTDKNSQSELWEQDPNNCSY